MNSRQTKVTIATGSFGGPATYSKLLKEKLPTFGYGVEVVNFGDVLKYPKIIRHIIYFFKVLKGAKGADIVYSMDPVSVGLPAILAAKIAGKRFFLKIVGDYAWEQGQIRNGVKDSLDEFSKKENYSFFVRSLKNIQTFVARRAEKIIVPSNYLKGILSNWGVDSKKIEVIYNAFVEPKVTESKEELRQKFNFNFPTIISVGRLVPWKGFETLIESMVSVRKDFSQVKLFIVDDGPDKEVFQKKVRDLKLDDMIVFLGRVSQAEMYKMIKAADVFALLSSYEGFSHLLIETLAIGTPIVTTPVGGNVEIIKDGENGLCVPYKDVSCTAEAIKNILNNGDLSNRLVLNGKAVVADFTEKIMLKHLSLVLR